MAAHRERSETRGRLLLIAMREGLIHRGMPKTISFWDHPVEKLEEALSIRKQIAALQAKLEGIFGSDEGEAPKPKANVGTKSGKRTMSPEARERIAAAQRARWAKSKGTTASSAKPAAIKSAKPGKAKRAMSPEARAKISAASKKRWATRK
jgi:hypothetical protein